MVVALSWSAWAQPSVDDSRRNAIVTAIEKVAPAVVTINVLEIRTQRVYDPFFEMFGFGPGGPQVREQAVESLGSGFLFDEAGHILTNFHVLQDAHTITSVTLPDGRDLKVELVGTDERTDLAVLRARGEALPHVALGDSEDLMPGEWVIAIGNPFGNMMRDPQPSVSVGVISANHRRVSREVGGRERLYQDLIQTDAAINPGNSGGPLVNARGEVIGINTMLFSNSGGYQGLGFAIPINRARRVALEIIQDGQRRDPWFGFRGQAVEALNDYAIQELGVRVKEGVLVTEIVRSSPAYQAGLQLGDVITEVNGQQVSHPTDIDFINWGLFVGDSVRMTVNRRGEIKNVAFTVREIKER
jgi:serine protease Do